MFTTAPLSQRDPRWSSLQLGFGDANSTIGNYGCTLTCLTLLANGHGFNETPATLNDKLKALGPNAGYAGDTRNLMIFTALGPALSGMRYLDRVWCESVSAPMDRINAALAANRAVVIQLDHSPAPFFQQHWVLLYGQTNGNYLIHDPWTWPTQNSVPISRDYGFTGPIEKIITHCVFYDGPSPSQPPPAAGPLVIIVNSDPDIVAAGGLALRNQPSFAGQVTKRLAANSELGLQENAATAIPKIGQPGQWLNVATNGSQGFVAAWLVHAQEVAVRAAIAPIKIPASQRQLQPDWNRVTLVVSRPKASTTKTYTAKLRNKASTGKIIAELRANSPLEIVGSQNTALKKVGVRGQWIKVRDNQGHIGYISALNVRVRKSNAPKKPQAKG